MTHREDRHLPLLKRLIVTIALAAPVQASAANVTVTIEDPGIQSADLLAIGATGGKIETFDAESIGSFSSYGSTLGTYSGVGRISNHTVWGGAEETPYLYVQGLPGTTLSLDTSMRYFGFWWSAGSGGNQVNLLSGGNSIFSFNTNDVVDFINTNAADPGAYYGNPNPGYAGQVRHEPFAFINMFSDTLFDAISFSGGNFESDNHTVATSYTGIQGTDISQAPSPVPLPATLALLAGGVAAMTFVSGRRRNV